MRSFVVVLFLTLCFAAVVLAGGPAQLMGSVEAVYHEGLVTFQVNHTDAVSMSIKVYDLETDALIYDSGPRAKTLVSWPAGYDVTGSFRYVVTAWNDQGEVVVSQAAVTKNLAPITAISFDTIPGDTKLLGPNEVIVEADLQVGAVQGFRTYRNYFGYGGASNWYEEDGSRVHTSIQPDFGGEGGWLHIGGSQASGGYITAEGMGTGGLPELFINGTSAFAVRSGNTGDASVVMPASSVSAAEMGNEPGVASMGSESTVSLAANTTTNVLARTIIAPTSGYVYAVASIDVYINKAAGETAGASCGLATTSFTIPGDGDQTTSLPNALPAGSYGITIPANQIFPVTAGTHTIYGSCRATVTGSIFDRHLTLAFFPTSYGTVSKSTESLDGNMEGVDGYVSSNTGMTQAEIDAERAESIAFNLARIQAELDAITAQAKALSTDDNNQR